MVEKDKLLEWAKDITAAEVSGKTGRPSQPDIDATTKYLESVYRKLVELSADE